MISASTCERSASCAGRSARRATSVSDWELRDLWDEAQRELDEVRLFGDLVRRGVLRRQRSQGARGEAGRVRERGRRRRGRARTAAGSRSWRQAEQPLAPFHWEIEFPEVFERENAGVRRDRGEPAVLAGKNLDAAQRQTATRTGSSTASQRATGTRTSSPTSSGGRSSSCASGGTLG